MWEERHIHKGDHVNASKIDESTTAMGLQVGYEYDWRIQFTPIRYLQHPKIRQPYQKEKKRALDALGNSCKGKVI